MALILRPCVICGEPMKTQRASKQTCSHRCYMQLYREQQNEKPPSQENKMKHNEETGQFEQTTQSLELNHEETN